MDTVIYKLHSPAKYPIVLKAIQDLIGGKGLLNIPDQDIYRKEKSFRKAWFNIKTDAFHLMSYNVKADLPSSSTGVQIMFDEQKDFVKFELSIAKFFYGNNVCEIIPAQQSKYYSASDLSMENLAVYWYRILKLVFQKIIHDLTRGLFIDVSWADVQVERVDIPFNQLFDDQREALHYLDSIKRVTMPKLSENNQTNYATGVTFLTDDYYFKVYHKGTDFTRTGISQIVAHYDDFLKKGLLYDGSPVAVSMTEVDRLQETADRTLRYELEAKKGLMKSLFNANLKKQKIPEYARLRDAMMYVMREENYNLIRAVIVKWRDDSGELSPAKTNPLLVYDPVYYVPENFVFKDADSRILIEMEDPRTCRRITRIRKTIAYLKFKFFLNGWKDMKNVYKFILKENDKHHQFFFDIEEVDSQKAILRDRFNYFDNDTGEYTDGNNTMALLQETPERQKFTPALLRLCIMKHNQMFQKLQFNKLPPEKDIELLCEQYNENLYSTLNLTGKKIQTIRVNTMKLLVMNLKKHTWDDLRKSGTCTRMTVYNWKKQLEKLTGFNKDLNFIYGIHLDNLSRKPSTLYFRHYDEMLAGKNALSLFLQNTPLLLTV